MQIISSSFGEGEGPGGRLTGTHQKISDQLRLDFCGELKLQLDQVLSLGLGTWPK